MNLDLTQEQKEEIENIVNKINEGYNLYKPLGEIFYNLLRQNG